MFSTPTEEVLWNLLLEADLSEMTLESESPIYGLMEQMTEWKEDYLLLKPKQQEHELEAFERKQQDLFCSLVNRISPEQQRTLKSYLKTFKPPNVSHRSNSSSSTDNTSTYCMPADGAASAADVLSGKADLDRMQRILDSTDSQRATGPLYSVITYKRDGKSRTIKCQELKSPTSMYKITFYRDYEAVKKLPAKEMWTAADQTITLYSNESDPEPIQKLMNTIALTATTRVLRVEKEGMKPSRKRRHLRESDEEPEHSE